MSTIGYDSRVYIMNSWRASYTAADDVCIVINEKAIMFSPASVCLLTELLKTSDQMFYEISLNGWLDIMQGPID